MFSAATDLPAEAGETNGQSIGMGMAFFGICAFMVALFLLMVWVGKLRAKRRGPRQAPELPLLVKDDERRERRRQSDR